MCQVYEGATREFGPHAKSSTPLGPSTSMLETVLTIIPLHLVQLWKAKLEVSAQTAN